MQPGFFDHQERLELLERQGDPLPKLERSVDREAFRPLLENLYKQSDPRKGGQVTRGDSISRCIPIRFHKVLYCL